jgi:hypothetical protein
MAKRARGTTRPGQRPPLQRSAARPATVPAAPVAAPVTRPVTLTDEEEARAAELEAEIVAEERQAEATKRQAKAKTVAPVPARATSSIAVGASEEYAYVARDVRRITLVGGSLILFLLGLWVLAHLLHIGPF